MCAAVPELKHLLQDAKSVASYYRCSVLRTSELHAIDGNRKAVSFPAFFEVRWAEYEYQLLNALWTNLPMCLKHWIGSNCKEAAGYMRKWTEVGRIRMLLVTLDVLWLLTRFQTTLQSNACIIFDVAAEAKSLTGHLQRMLTDPFPGGEEENFVHVLRNPESSSATYQYNLGEHRLWQKERRTN